MTFVATLVIKIKHVYMPFLVAIKLLQSDKTCSNIITFDMLIHIYIIVHKYIKVQVEFGVLG